MQYAIIPHLDDRVCLIHGDQTGRRHPLGKDELMHYRTKDSVNGVRRYQNKDGSLTPLGRIHYGIEHPREWYATHRGPDTPHMYMSGQEQAERYARKAAEDYKKRQAAAQTPQVKPAEKKYSFGAAPSNLQAAKPKAAPAAQAAKPASSQPQLQSEQQPKPAYLQTQQTPKTVTPNQGQRLTKDQMIEQTVREHSSSNPSQPITKQRVDEIKELTRDNRSAAPSSSGSGGSLYNLDGTKKTEQPSSSQPQLQSEQQPKPAYQQAASNGSGGIGKEIERVANDMTKGASDLWNRNIVPTAANAENNVSGFVNGALGNVSPEELRFQQHLQRGGAPNNVAAIQAGQGLNNAVTGAINDITKGASDVWNHNIVPTAQNIGNAVTGGLNDAGAYLQGLTGNQAEVRRQQDMQRTGMPNNAAAAVAGQQMNKNINNAAQNTGNLFQNMWNGFTGAVNDAGKWIGDTAGNIGNAVTGAVNDAGKWISDTAGNVGNAVTGAVNDAGKGISDFWNNSVVPTAQNVGNAVTGTVNDAGKWIGDTAGNIGNAVTGAVNDAGKAVGDAVNSAGQFAGDTFRNTQNWVNNEAVPAINRAAQNTEQFVNQTVVPGAQAAAQNTGNLFQNMWNGFTGAVNDAGKWIGDTAGNIGNAVTGAVNDAGKWISDTAGNVGNAVTGAVNGAGKWIGDTAGNIGNAVTGAVNDAGKWIGDTAGNIGNAVTGAVNDAGKWIGDTAQNIGQFATGAYNGFVNGDINPVKWNYQSQNADPDSRNGYNLGNGARQLLNNVGDAVTGVVNGAGQGISDVWNRNIVPAAVNAGNNVSGFVNGALGNVSPEELRFQQHLQRGGAPNNVAAIQAGQGLNNAVTGTVNGARDVWNNQVVPTAQNAWNNITGENARRQQVAGNFAASNANENMASAQRQQMRSRLASIPGMSPNYLNSLTDSQLLSIYNNRFGQADAANYNRAQQAYQANSNAYNYREAMPQRFAQSTATEAQKSAQASQQRNSLRQQLMATGGYNPATLYSMNDSDLLELYRRTFPNR